MRLTRLLGLVWKAIALERPESYFPLGGCKSKSLLPQDLTVLLSKGMFQHFTCSSIGYGDATKRLPLMER